MAMCCTEESGETFSTESNGVAEWLCPLCQKGQPNRSCLSLHLTEQHSVLPSCVDNLLDIAVIKQGSSRGEGNQRDLKSSGAESSQLKHAEVSADPCQSSESSDATQTPGDKEMEEERITEPEGGDAESVPEEEGNQLPGAKQQNTTENTDIPDTRDNSVKNGVQAENNTQSFKCNACQETFPGKTALKVHYNSASHIQRMTKGPAKQGGDLDPPASSFPFLSRPYVLYKPYQCATCHVSYNHAITLESHMKSVLHQTRSRNAKSAVATASLGGTTTGVLNTEVTTSGSGTSQLVTTNCAAPGTLMVTTTKEGEQIQTSQVAPSLLTSPVASAQAVSAFLTLLTSRPNNLPHSLLPSLFAAGAVPGAAVPQLVPQPQMVLPLILNGLQAQTQQHQENQQGQLLTQCLPFVENGSDQIKDSNSLITEDINKSAQCPNIEVKGKVENKEDNGKAHRDSTTDGDSSTNQLDLEGDKDASLNLSPVGTDKSLRNKNLSPSASVASNSSSSPLNLNLTLSPDSTPQKSQSGTSPCGSLVTPKSSPNTIALTKNRTRGHCNDMRFIYADLPVLSEFQSEVLWAFFESRSEADAASPPREDCEALGREVGLSEEDVRRWLSQARHLKQRQRATGLQHLQRLAGFTRHSQSSDNDYDDEESSLVIAEDDIEPSGSHAMDLSRTGGKRRQRNLGRRGRGDSCLTSDSENELYTSIIVSDEESQNGSLRGGPESPAKDGQSEVGVGGKVLRSTTVFLSDAEDEYEENEGGPRAKRKKLKGEFDQVEVKKERQDSDVDLELEAQGDPPGSQSHAEIPTGALHSLPLSLAPFSTQFLSPYVLSLTPTLLDGCKLPLFPNPPTITRFSSSLLSPSLSSHSQTSHYLSNGGDCESALDLSMGKNNSKSASSSSSLADKIAAQKGQLLDGLGLRPTSKGLVVVQNMRARERKGEVRFISDGTLAAVGKPLIKFTWPLSKPIFSNKPAPNNTGCITTTPIVRTLIKTEREPVKELANPVVGKKICPVPIKPREVSLVSSTTVSPVSSSASAVPKTMLETTSNVPMVKVVPKMITPVLLSPPKDPIPIAPRPAQKRKLEDESEEEKTDDERDNDIEMGSGPGTTNRMVPKLPTAFINNRPPATTVVPQKQNGLSYWTPKVPIKINTLSREQLALPKHSSPRTIPPPPTPSIAPVSPNTPISAKVASPSTPLSILQSCYETCAHPNAMECEAIGTELNLPLKVVQIWFQNTRAKEKRWRLQQEKMSPLSGGKVDMSSGSYLQYNALKANRPILPKPVQLTVTESPASPVAGQPGPKETLTGRCDACSISFESRAAARAHVFSPRHLATLRTTNFGQPTTLVNKNGTGSHVPQSTPLTSSGGEMVIDSPPPTATSNS
ncbi:hypothetical protein KUCAC02_017671 [Chaenocephalus aceratus]|uniref:Uncharacterized protein n=1 Tax=Chaenocephalus aceratus TaxID=36190 RepID=A0ACB9W3B3_CHAAC|nr:hypothetical protein KUCAC02_017671 [Chaenocephalus aceratus]